MARPYRGHDYALWLDGPCVYQSNVYQHRPHSWYNSKENPRTNGTINMSCLDWTAATSPFPPNFRDIKHLCDGRNKHVKKIKHIHQSFIMFPRNLGKDVHIVVLCTNHRDGWISSLAPHSDGSCRIQASHKDASQHIAREYLAACLAQHWVPNKLPFLVLWGG